MSLAILHIIFFIATDISSTSIWNSLFNACLAYLIYSFIIGGGRTFTHQIQYAQDRKQMLTFWTDDLSCSLPLPSEVDRLNKNCSFHPCTHKAGNWTPDLLFPVENSAEHTLLLLSLHAHLNVHPHPAVTWCHPGPIAILLKTLSSDR